MTSMFFGIVIFHPIWLLALVITVVIAAYAQHRVTSAYNKNARIPSRGGITGREAADAIMRKAGIREVEIVPIRGHLTDHYDPIKKRLALSEENFYGTSLAALGVAAHEAGHAIQHKVGYQALKARMALVPITSFSSQLLPFVLIGGFFFHIPPLVTFGIAIYMILTIFQLITLPVEFDASRRARMELAGLGIIGRDEEAGVTETLNAAGLTYLAAFIGSLLHLIALILMRR